MATKPREEAAEVVVPIRRGRRAFEGVPEVSFATKRAEVNVVEPPVADGWPEGKEKCWFLLGDGGTGKTTVVKWMVGRRQEQGRGGALLAALDPGKRGRSLASWFSDVEEPEEGEDPSRWLGALTDDLRDDPRSAMTDFGGGGQVALTGLVKKTKEFHKTLENDKIGLVACYTLGHRLDNLIVLNDLEESGFQPKATLLLVNEGIPDPTRPASEVFEAIRNHSAYRNAVKRGAIPIWMPRLDSEVMEEIERKRLSFTMARDGKVPAGATFSAIGGWKRSAVTRWMDLMEEAFKPVATWLP